MKKLYFLRIVSLMLVLASLLSIASCQKKKAPSQTDNNDSSNNSQADDGSALATKRYPYTPGNGTSDNSLESLLGAIDAGNGLLWYEFEEKAGSTVLRSSLAKERNSTGMKATLVSDGYKGNAIRFDGKSDHVKLNNGFSELSQITSSTFLHPAYSEIAVSFYIKPDSVSSTQIIYEQGDENCGLAIGIKDGKLIAAVGASDQSTGKGNVTTLTADFSDKAQKWTNVALSFDGKVSGGSAVLYIDGIKADEKSDIGECIPQTLDAAGLATPQYGTNALSLTGNCRYAGLMDDLRIYNRSLTYSGKLEDTAVFLQSAAAKNHYVKAGTVLGVSTFVDPTLRGFVLTYGLADEKGYSFRQTGTDNFIVNDNGALTVSAVSSDNDKKNATFYMEDALALPSWGEHTPGAFRSYKAYGSDLYITSKDGRLVLQPPDQSGLLSSVFKVTGDQTKVVEGLKGAVYYPSYALNAPQFWKWYDHAIIDRDMSYATELLGVNSFRIWVSYEYWLEEPEHFDAAFRDFLDLAEKHGISIMVSLFEGCGEGYSYTSSITWSREYLGSRACWSVTSPSPDIYNNKNRWSGPKNFVKYFINSFGDDRRLMSIETYNEPWNSRHSLAMYLTEYAVSIQKSVPLTIGSAPADPINVTYSVDAGMDMIQYHDNFPGSAPAFENNAIGKKEQGRLANLPVYCTEVQWVGGPANINYPVYSNLAPTVNKLMQDGTWAPYYWTLMVHPCYLQSYRNNHQMYNGIINEDGSVNNKANAQAIANSKNDYSVNTYSPYTDGSYTYKHTFSDNFFDLKAHKWTAVSGSWSAKFGYYSGSGLTLANDTDFEDFNATFTLKGSGGMVFRAKDKNNYYYAEYDSSLQQLRLYKVTNGSKELLASSSKLEENIGVLSITVSAAGSQLRVFTNCCEATAADSTYTSGAVGFASESSGQFDDLIITPALS